MEEQIVVGVVASLIVAGIFALGRQSKKHLSQWLRRNDRILLRSRKKDRVGKMTYKVEVYREKYEYRPTGIVPFHRKWVSRPMGRRILHVSAHSAWGAVEKAERAIQEQYPNTDVMDWTIIVE